MPASTWEIEEAEEEGIELNFLAQVTNSINQFNNSIGNNYSAVNCKKNSY